VAPRTASAATVLFVSNEGADANLVTALTADGHEVTTGGDWTALSGDLSAYDAVFWAATGSYDVDAATFTNLTSYVRNGGRVFVTGYDAIISNTMLASFCGGAGARDLVGSPGPGSVSSAANSLTTGVVDIRGVSPTGGHTDRDGLTGLTSDTVEVVGSVGGGTTQWALRTVGDGEIAYVSNGTYGGPHPSWEDTSAGGAGAYNAAIRNFAFAADSASADPGAPEITLEGPTGVDEGSAAELSATFVDAEGDSFTFSWDLDDDGNFGENAGMNTYAIEAATTDGPSSRRVGIRAVDSAGHTSTRYRNLRVDNVAPQITSDPPLVTSVGVNLRYAVVATDPAGDSDPLTYTLVRGPERMSITPEGVVQWTPTDSDVTRADATVSIEVRVEDDDEGATTQAWELTVSPNRQPTPPVPVYPTGMVAIIDRMPRLAVSNSQDLDLDPLTYRFELDTEPTFDSPNRRESGTVAEGAGFTAWELSEPLDEDQVYYWRAWASDGTVDSEPREAVFYVVRDPSLPPPDAGRPDAGPPSGSDGGLIPGDDAGLGRSGGGCSVSATGHARGPVSSRLVTLLVLGAVALVLRRRRR
jgi:MYXO-CTERM domain-containing protein